MPPGAVPPGGAPGLQGGGKFKEDSAEYAVEKLVAAILADNLSDAGELLSKKAKGVAKSLRSGELDDQGEKLKDDLAGAKIVASQPLGGRKLVVMESKSGDKKIQFTVGREDGNQVIEDIVVRNHTTKSKGKKK